MNELQNFLSSVDKRKKTIMTPKNLVNLTFFNDTEIQYLSGLDGMSTSILRLPL